MTKNNIISKLQQKRVKNYLYTKGVSSLYLFGSYVHQNENPQSDVDLLYETNGEKMTFSTFLSVKHFLQTELGKEVDFVDKKYLHKNYKQIILDEVEPIF